MRKLIPPDMPFVHALRLGYTGEIRMPGYVEWIRTRRCWKCLATAPSQCSHTNFFKSQKRKGPDPLSLPECATDHNAYEASGATDETNRLAAAAIHMLEAIFEGHLVWRSNPKETSSEVQWFMREFVKALDFHDGHGSPTIDRAVAEMLYTTAKRWT